MDLQATISKPFTVEGVNVYTGKKNYVEFRPGKPNSGIICEYLGMPIRASLENAVYTGRSIGLRRSGVEIKLTEHDLSAPYVLGITNIEAELSDGVFPTRDDVAEECFNQFKKHIEFQEAPKKLLKFKAVDRHDSTTIRSVTGGPDSIRIEPAEGSFISYLAYYPKEGIGPLTQTIPITPKAYQDKIMNARPLVRDIPFEFLNEPFLWLGKKGFHGITERNYLFPQKGINPEGFEDRYKGNEPVNHKILDVLGTLALTGAHFRETMFRFNMTGHRFDLNTLRAVMGDSTFVEYTGSHKKRKSLRLIDGAI